MPMQMPIEHPENIPVSSQATSSPLI